MIIPAIITRLLLRSEGIKPASLHPAGDFNDVRGICDGLISLAKYEEAVSRDINISSGKEVSI